jgi:hypothetical protein
MSWKQLAVNKKEEPYQPTSSSECHSSVILGIAVAMMVRSCAQVSHHVVDRRQEALTRATRKMARRIATITIAAAAGVGYSGSSSGPFDGCVATSCGSCGFSSSCSVLDRLHNLSSVMRGRNSALRAFDCSMAIGLALCWLIDIMVDAGMDLK